MAVGANPDGTVGSIEAFTTSDDGATWTAGTLSAPQVQLDAVACTSPSDCVAGGSNTVDLAGEVVTTTDGGATWTSSALPAGAPPVSSLSCASSTSCVAVGSVGANPATGAALQTHDGGRTWS